MAVAASLLLHLALAAGIESSFGAPSDSGSQPGREAPLRAELHSLPPMTGGPQPSSAGVTTVAQVGMRSLLPWQRYYPTRELDVRPGIMTRVEPVYPDSAARRFLSGKVVIRLFIDEAGAVERVVTVKAEPPGYFEQSAERAFRAARFTPGMKNGRPVKVQMVLEVRFDSSPAPQIPGPAIPR